MPHENMTLLGLSRDDEVGSGHSDVHHSSLSGATIGTLPSSDHQVYANKKIYMNQFQMPRIDCRSLNDSDQLNPSWNVLPIDASKITGSQSRGSQDHGLFPAFQRQLPQAHFRPQFCSYDTSWP